MTPPLAPTGTGGARREGASPDAKAAPKPSAKKETEVDRLNKRVAFLRKYSESLRDVTVAHQAKGQGGDHVQGLAKLAAHAEGVLESLKDYQSALFGLKTAKWVPVPGRAFVAGQEVGFKPWFAVRYTKHGAYTAKEIEKVRVVSVHGDAAKVQTLKGEALGLIPTSVLTKI